MAVYDEWERRRHGGRMPGEKVVSGDGTIEMTAEMLARVKRDGPPPDLRHMHGGPSNDDIAEAKAAAQASRALALTAHPDNVPVEPGEKAGKPEARGKRIGRLSETLQERLLIKLLDEKLSAAASQAMVDILEGGEDRARVELLKEILKHTPVPTAVAQAVTQQVVAIQIGGGLRRGAKEFG